MTHKRRFKGFDYSTQEAKPPEDPEPTEASKGEWVHRGGGYYENTVTGESRRGKP